MDNSFIRSSLNIGSIVDSYNSHYQEVANNKKEIYLLLENIKKGHKCENTKLMNSVKNLQSSMSELSKDVESIKYISKSNESAKKVELLVRNKDVFSLIDEGKSLISDAKISLDEILKESSSNQKLESEKMQANDQFHALVEKIQTVFNHADQNPKTFENAAEKCTQLLKTQKGNLVLTTYAHRCYDKAADIYLKNGNIQQAFEMHRLSAEVGQIDGSHFLYNLEPVLDQMAGQQDLAQKGLKFSGLDSGELKQGTISFRKRQISGQKKIQAVFRVPPYARANMNKTLSAIHSNLPAFISSLPPNIKSTVKILNDVEDGYQGEVAGEFRQNLKDGLVMGKAIEIQFQGIGSVKVGNDPREASLYQRFTVEIDANQPPGQAMNKMQAMLNSLGMGYILGEELPEEIERKKIACLFHTFYPKDAFSMEREQIFYEMSPSYLQEEIVKRVPAMKEVFANYLDNSNLLKLEEMSPNYSVLSINDLSDHMQKVGAVGLMAGFEGDVSILAKVITGGPLASQERFESALTKTIGASSIQDHRSGGARSVFTRVLTKKMMDAKRVKINYDDPDAPQTLESACQVERFPYSGTCQLLYDLSAVNRGGYAYKSDRYGSKLPPHYNQRDNLIDFTKNLNQNDVSNEVMIPEHIPPDKLKKILVRSAFSKETLIENMEQEGLVEVIEGKKYLKGFRSQDLDQLIIVGRAFTPEMWD